MEGKKTLWKNSIFLTFVAMLLGAVLGMVFGNRMSEFKFIGDIWLNCLKMILVPMVFCTMTLAVGTQSNIRTLGRVALRIFLYYTLTTCIAAGMGLLTASVLKPGSGMSLEGFAGSEVTGTAEFSFSTFFSSLFSGSIFQSFAEANMMQTIVIAVMLGTAIIGIKDEKHKKGVIDALSAANDWISVYLGAVIKMAPIGVLFLMADSFGRYGMILLSGMFGLIGTFWFAVLVQVLLVYCPVLWFSAGVSPIRFLRESMQVWSFTIATCSSVANIPNSIECAEKKFNVPSYISKFCIPLGAQINYDGSAILYGCIMVFLPASADYRGCNADFFLRRRNPWQQPGQAHGCNQYIRLARGDRGNCRRLLPAIRYGHHDRKLPGRSGGNDRGFQLGKKACEEAWH